MYVGMPYVLLIKQNIPIFYTAAIADLAFTPDLCSALIIYLGVKVAALKSTKLIPGYSNFKYE